MACRSLERCDKAAQHVLRSSNVHADKLVTRHLDLSSFSSIRKFANDYNKGECYVKNSGLGLLVIIAYSSPCMGLCHNITQIENNNYSN